MRTTRARLKSGQSEAARNEIEKILQTQKMLRARRLQENRERFKEGTAIDDDGNKHVQKLTSINSYREATDFPAHLRPSYCGVDETHNVVFIPFNNIHVPFHISTIRSAQWQLHDTGKVKFSTIRFAFHVPGASGESEILPNLTGNREVFIKEVAIKSDKAQHCQELVKKVHDLQKRLKNKESLGPTAQIAPIIPNRSNNKYLLRHVMVRYVGCPTRRSIGNLEAHQNGVRYTGAGGREIITINYSNVKHCVFQPCKSDLHTILHFHLQSPILVNNKRQYDIQFYTEVCAMVDDLQSRRRRMRDPDELAEEAKELQIQNRTNLEYKRFVEGMETFSKEFEMMVEVPIRKLAFRGVPKNENVLLMPTSRALVHLSSWPTFLISLEEIEIVCLERVSHGLRNFDLTIVFKDHSKSALTINACDVSAIDQIKRWLTECDIVWYESTVPLNWRQILKTIRQDPSGFYNELGGFGAFMADGDDGKEGGGEGGMDSDSDDEDELFRDNGEEDYSEEDEDEGSSDVSLANEGASDDSEGSGGSSTGDEGVEEDDWDKMESKAAAEDQMNKAREKAITGHTSDDSDESTSPNRGPKRPAGMSLKNLSKKRRM